MDGIMREPHLELRIKDLQFGAYLIHRAFVDLHEIHEFGEFFRRKRPPVHAHGIESGFQVIRVDAALSVKYHGSPS